MARPSSQRDTRSMTTSSSLAACASNLGAILFDLDGVLTPTAELHEESWKHAFDEFLRTIETPGSVARPFDHDDYVHSIDGRPRLDGVRSFLRSRGITLPEQSDDPASASVQALGDRKNAIFQQALRAGVLRPLPGAAEMVAWARQRGLRTAVVSASRNCGAVLTAAGLAGRFDARIDGEVAARDGLRGKPAPDTYKAAARALGVPPNRCMVIEDAIAGVEAGHAGGFGLVVGIDRSGDGAQLIKHGADLAVHNLAELLDALTKAD
jgi:beta-phosphoglucomutase family hydrolase